MSSRYTGIAIGLHWLIAILIICLLAVGKYMTSLALDDPQRYNLTQWHKSFGISVLVLSLYRLYWRTRHKPPADTTQGPAWEKTAANVTHRLFYLLMILVPLSGWLLVSASPLNIPTLLFQTIPWPHLPLVSTAGNKEFLTTVFFEVHHLASDFLLILLLLHVGAALKHHFYLKDGLLTRMSLFNEEGKFASGLLPLLLVICTAVAGIVGFNQFTAKPPPVTTTTSQVTFTTSMTGQELKGMFADTQVEIQLDPAKPDTGQLSATVMTASFRTGDAQVDASLPGSDWFDVKNYPEASFVSNSMQQGENDSITVSGSLTIKDISQDITFPMNVVTEDNSSVAKGGFTINRMDFKIGTVDQPDDEYVGFNVIVEFAFKLN